MDREPAPVDLDLRKLRYFVAVADELNFGRAAERLHITQPALSRQVRKLEHEVGADLLERTSRHVALTATGRALLDEARPLLAGASAARRRVRRATGSPRSLTVGFFIGDPVGPVSRAFAVRHPDITLELTRIYWYDQAEAIRDGRADVAFAHGPTGEVGLELIPLYTVPRVALLPRGHPAAMRATISLADLADDPVIRHRDASPAWEAHHAGPRPQGRTPLPGPTVSNLEEKLEHVAAGRGTSMVPVSVAQAVQLPSEVVAVPVADAEPTQVYIAWSALQGSPLPREFAEVALVAVDARRAPLPPAAVTRDRAVR